MRAAAPRARLRAYAFSLLTTAVVLSFALAEWWTERYVAERSRLVGTAIEITIVVVATLLFRPVHRRVERAVEAAFTRRRREAMAALVSFRRELTSFNDIGQLLRRAIEAIEHHLETAACAIYLRRDVYRAEASTFETPAPDVELDDPLAIRLRSTGAPARPQQLRSAATGGFAFPMTVGGDLIGFVCVSSKYGEFEPEEMQMLTSLAEGLGLALVTLDPWLRDRKPAESNNLPADLPPVYGRDDELSQIKTLLAQSRLVTLTGAGGVGKTRMALLVAAEIRHFRDGSWFVDLAPIDDASLVPSAIAQVFGVADEGGDQRLIERVAAALQQRHVLIVLDNCEHVIGAAAESVSTLLRACPGVHILATSREPLGLQAEQPYRMPSLPLSAAVELFAARARTAEQNFTVSDENRAIVEEIVTRLDGIAMAIELAAPRVKVLSLQQLAHRLGERFTLLSAGGRGVLPRHQTLHALIAWSYDLLSDPEKQLLRASAVFRGDWTIDAAEAVCAGMAMDGRAVIDVLEALVDKSLINVRTENDCDRYRLLETTREFANDRLNESGERNEVISRHCGYYASLARAHGAIYWQTDSDMWIAGVQQDLENYRAAIAWGLSGGDALCAAEIVADTRWFWYTTARREGYALLERVKSASSPQIPERIGALLSLTHSVFDGSARAQTSAAYAAAHLGDDEHLARVEALTLYGTALGRAGKLEESRAHLTQGLDAARLTGLPRLVGWALILAAYWFSASGERTKARDLFEEAAAVLRSCGDRWQLARLQLHRAEFLFIEGEPEAALAGVREAEHVFRERHSDNGVCIATLNAAAYLLAMQRWNEGWHAAREGLELALRLDSLMPGTWAIGHLAEIAAEFGDARLAARLLGFTDAAYAKTGSAREPTEQRGYDRALERVCAELPLEQLRPVLAQGAALEFELAAAEAATVPEPGKTDQVQNAQGAIGSPT